MATNFWTFGDIKTAVRDIVGLKSTNQLSENDLEEEINRYYFYQFVLETHPPELESYWTFSTSAGVDTKAFDDDTTIFVNGDGWIDGYPLAIYSSPEEWFSRWPETTTYTQSRPTEALLYANTLTMNPPPDDVYSVKIPIFARPTTLVDDTDTPVREEWGQALTYGTAFEILLKKGDSERAAQVESMKMRHIDNIRYKQAGYINTQRAMPRW